MKETSKAAFRDSRTTAEKHRTIILDVLKNSKTPLSSMQIATKCYLDYHQVARRMSELEEAGKVVDSKEKAVNPSGYKAAMYKLPSEQLELSYV